MIKKLVLIAILLFGWNATSAHTGGFTYETTKNDFFIDIGASKPEFVPGELILFEYNLYKVTDPNNLADFDSVYVTISDETAVRLANYVHRPDPTWLTTLSYDFPDGGQYEMSARFQKAGETMVEVTFPMTVKDAEEKSSSTVKIGVLFGILGIAIGYGSAKLKPKAN